MKQNASTSSICGKKQVKKSAQVAKKSKNVKPAKSAQVAKKKKKMIDVKTSAKDTIAETISFVIKGKLTPIKPTPISLNKITRVKVVDKKANVNFKEKKTKPKVQNKTAKSTGTVKTVKKCTAAKKMPVIVKIAPTKKCGTNIENINKKRKKNANDTAEESPKSKPKKLNIIPAAKAQKESAEDEIQKQKTIEKLLKEANKALKTKPVNVKKKFSREKKNVKQSTKHDQKKSLPKVKEKEKIPKIKKADSKNEPRKEEIAQKPVNIKIEPCLKENMTLVKEKLPNQISIKVKEEKDAAETNKVELNVNRLTSKKHELKSQGVKKEKANSIKVKPKLKSKAKVLILKRKGISSKEVLRLKEERRKSKLYNFWNAPKKTRVASLNALAKVQCLYENESKAVFDKIEESSILRKAPLVKKETDTKVADNVEDLSASDEDNGEKPFQRTLRSVPGLRAVGKHWDMLDTSSSSDENSTGYKSNKVPFKKVRIKKEPAVKKMDNEEGEGKVAPVPQKRVRKPKPELTMDLKDMVVRKRMASLNASAILAASYSVEKRFKTSRSGDSSSYDTDSSDDYFIATDDECEKKQKTEEEAPKEEDRKLIEVHTTPNKKVAVILNQDTDVTITGVYVNSTTRSTHHEGYCSIAGMQYRISATSHTQTAATAVSTETLLQTTSASDNTNAESQPSCSSKSYTPLDALSNMQPPSAPPGIQHPPPPPGHHVMPAMVPPPSHQIGSSPHRHQAPPPGCGASAFSSPHHTPASYPPQGHQPGTQASGEPPPGYVHGYYQPAGPLITVPHGHGQHPVPPPQQPHPPPPPLSKSVSLSDTTSPSSATSPLQPHAAPPPPAPSSNGDSSDSEVIITSVTAGTKELPPPGHPTSYRYSQYPSPGSYSYPYPAYHYPTPHPNPPYTHHDLCYSAPAVNSYIHHPKYPTSYGRYLTSSRYYPGSPSTEMYPPPPGALPTQPNQQVSSSPVSSNNSPYPTAPAGPPPPPTIIETYPPPPAPPTLVETYQPPPHHYYPSAYGIPPSCYNHSPARAIPYMNPTYQNCPCPMQSCPKNVLTGPLTGESKRSNISKDSMPLPPVALALPLEPASATGPPSPARGSAGMPPPPSPAGATYQPPPPIAKQESHLIERQPDCNGEKKRKARVGKAMVRNNMQNTMLLMCNPTQNYVKREIESPKDKEELHKKEECLPADSAKILPETFTEKSCLEDGCTILKNEIKDDKVLEDQSSKHFAVDIKSVEKECMEQKHDVLSNMQPLPPKEDEPLPPCIATVAENVKVKNMKRKQLIANIQASENTHPPPAKKKKIGSYKDFIRKHTNCFKINNGKRKLISKSSGKSRMPKIRVKAPIKRKQNTLRDQKNNKRIKLSVSSHAENFFKRDNQGQAEEKERFKKIVNSKPMKGSPKLAEKALDNLISKNNINKTIEDVIRTVVGNVPVRKNKDVTKSVECKINAKDKSVNKMVGDKNVSKISENKYQIKFGNSNTFENKNCKQVKADCKKNGGASRRKSTSGVCRKENVVAEVVSKVPRRSLHLPRWSNGWRWEGDPYEANIFMNSDEITVLRRCYPAMRHEGGDLIVPRDCVLLKAGPRKNDLPYVAKIASLWENPDDGEMMMSLLWYYRPEHTEQGRLPSDQIDEVFASKHKDSNSVACIDDKCYVLTFNEYCRYRKIYRRLEEGLDEIPDCIPIPEPYPRADRQPPSNSMSPDMIFFCRKVYDFRQKRIIKNPT